MPHPTAKSEEGSLELTEEIMRLRAYRFFEERGCEEGHDLEDWLRAETEVFGKKAAIAEPADIVRGIGAAVAKREAVWKLSQKRPLCY
jgi:hypothetical protein